MDWNAAIERNREALKRILAMLVAMAALPVLRSCGDAGITGGGAGFLSPLWGGVRGGGTLPRHLHRAVLRLLRPAEAAARRLVIVAARGLVVVLPRQPRPRKPKPKSAILRNGVGTGILMPPVMAAPPPLTPPHKGEGIVHVAPGPAADIVGGNVTEPPSPLWGGVGGVGKNASTRRLSFQLFDPLHPLRGDSRPAASGIPRISFPGFSAPSPVPVRRALSPHDPIDATRLVLRLSALGRALDDLPKHARRFARWRAARDAAGAQNGKSRDAGLVRRVAPLRPGCPPGWRRKPVHEVHDVLNDIHGLAFWALERPDTS